MMEAPGDGAVKRLRGDLSHRVTDRQKNVPSWADGRFAGMSNPTDWQAYKACFKQTQRTTRVVGRLCDPDAISDGDDALNSIVT